MLLAEKNSHPRDTRIRTEVFSDGKQNTYIDGELCNGWGITRVLDRWFPIDMEAIDEHYEQNPGKREIDEISNRRDRLIGVMNSECAERFLDGLPFKPNPEFPEFKCFEDVPGFKNFLLAMQTLPKEWKPYRSEWPLFWKKRKRTGKPDIVLVDTTDTLCLRLIIIDLKYQKRPTATFCSRNKPNAKRRTACKSKNLHKAASHALDCPARAKGALSHLLNSKDNKCGAQMALYRAMILEKYQKQTDKPIIIDNIISIFIRPGDEYIHTFDRDGISLFDPAVHEVLIASEVNDVQ
jgi:hypothetical protein